MRKSFYILFPLLIYFLIHDMAEVLLWLGLELVSSSGEQVVVFLDQHADTVRGVVNGIASFFGLVVIWQAVKGEIGEIEDSKPSDKWLREEKVTGYMFLAVLAVLSAIGLNFLLNLIGLSKSSRSFEQIAQAQYGVAFLAGLFLYGILSPLVEEAVFRGLIYNRMKRCFNYPIALILSSLLFGCYHGNLVQAVYGTLLGIIIAYTYELYESFAAPVLFHTVANVSVYVLTYNNNLSQVSTKVSIVVMAGTLIGASACMVYIKKVLAPKMEK